MQWRTQTVPNHRDKHRDVVEGWDRWLPRIVGAVALIGTIWAASARVTSIENKLEARDRELPDKIAAAIAANDKTSDHVTRWELDQYKQAQLEALNAALAPVKIKLDFIDQHGRHTLAVAEKLPGAQETR